MPMDDTENQNRNIYTAIRIVYIKFYLGIFRIVFLILSNLTCIKTKIMLKKVGYGLCLNIFI